MQPMQNENEKLLKETKEPGLFSDVWNFLRTSKKWWIVPLLVVFLVLGVILGLAQTGAAPFIYVLF